MDYLFYNELSDSSRGKEEGKTLYEELKAHFPDLQLKSVQEVNPGEFIASCSEDDTVILAGGDGALNHFANALRRRALPDDLLLPDRPGQRLHERRARERDERRRKIHSPAGGFIWAAPP